MINLRSILTILAGSAFILMSADVRGIVLDENKKPIAGATVIASTLPDSTFVNGTITGANGKFNIKTSLDKVALKVSFLGYETVNMLATDDAQNSVQLQPDVKALSEVTVIADGIKYKAGGYTARLDNSRLTEGKEAPQLLAYLPGISEKDGEINVLTRKPAAIYVDGIKVNSQEELKAITASSMQSVDVSFMAGAGELTSSGGAIIRIKLRKNVNMGYSGYLKGQLDIMPNYGYTGEGATGYISGRYNKLSVSNHLYYNRNKMIGDEDISNEFSGENKQQEIKELRGWNPYVFDRLNLTYEINKNHSLGASGFFSHHTTDVTQLGKAPVTDEIMSRQNTGNRTNMAQAVANYTWLWGPNGSGLYITGDYLHSDTRDSLHITDTDTHLTSSEKSRNNLYSIKAEAKFQALKGNMSAGAGYQGVDYAVDVTTFHNPIHQTDMQAHRPYMYATYQGRAGMFNYEVGLRYQWNRTIVNSDKSTDRNRFNGLCPSVSLVYIINPIKGHMVMVNYERALDKIPYSAISSYRSYITPDWYQTGNPAISTPINDNIIAALSLFSKFTLSVGAFLINDPIYYGTEEQNINGTKTIVTTARNGRYQRVGFGQLEYNLAVGKWWIAKPNVSLTSMWASTPDYRVSDQKKWKVGLNNSFTFSDTFGATLGGYWESNCQVLDMTFKSVSAINGSVYKKFLKNKLQLKIDFTAWRKGRTIITHGTGVNIETRNFTHTPDFTISAQWNFRGGKKVSVKNNITETQEIYKYSNIGRN